MGIIFLPLPVLRERVGVRVLSRFTKSPHPNPSNPLPEYREGNQKCDVSLDGSQSFQPPQKLQQIARFFGGQVLQEAFGHGGDSLRARSGDLLHGNLDRFAAGDLQRKLGTAAGDDKAAFGVAVFKLHVGGLPLRLDDLRWKKDLVDQIAAVVFYCDMAEVRSEVDALAVDAVTGGAYGGEDHLAAL